MEQSYSVFISAVTREFGSARDALANALQARGIDVKVQRAFDLGDGTTLSKLHDCIRKCDRVIAVVGTYSGMSPPDGAVTDVFRAMLPDGMVSASLTQWEVIFAQHYRRQIYFFEASGFAPEQPASDDDNSTAQAAWCNWLFDRGIGRDRRQFRTAEGLRADVMELDWPNFARLRPSNLPVSIGQLFKGRGEFLDQLREGFKHNPAAAITGKAVHGLGGVGKTRAAIEYGHAYSASYAGTFFLTGKSEADLRDSLAALASAAVLDLAEQDVPDLDARGIAVVRWLRTNPGWLLIIDNVDDEPAVKATRTFLDQVSSGEGHILITSRVSDWGHVVEPLELDLLSLDAAKELLCESTPHRSKRGGDDVALTRLADEQLGCLSLALVQAAAFIDERRIGFADYVALFETETAQLLTKLGEAAVRNLSYPLPVALTWRTSFAQLGESGQLLLEMLAWLSIEPIPRGLFAVWPHAEIVDLDEGLAELTRYSFVHWEAENKAITLHRLVAQVTRDNLDSAGRDRALSALFPWLFAINPIMNAADVRCWPVLLPLLPHALSLFYRTSQFGPYMSQASVYDEYACLLHSLARYSEAEPLYRRALEIDEQRYGAEHPAVTGYLSNLAGLLSDTNRRAEAEPLYRRALAIDEASFGPDHFEVATDLNNLGGLLQSTDRLAEAEPLYRRALEIDEAYYGPDDARLANRLNNLASLFRTADRMGEAEPLFRRALRIAEANYGSDHPNVAICLNNLAEVLSSTDRIAEAEQNCRRALAIHEASYGPNHPDVATQLNNLARILGRTGRWSDAVQLSGRCALILLRLSKSSGHLMPNTVPSLINYASTLLEVGHKPKVMQDILSSVMLEAGFDPSEFLPLILEELAYGLQSRPSRKI